MSTMNLNNLTNFIDGTPTTPTPSSGKNHLSAEVEIKGTLRFENELLFDGKIEGEVLSEAGTLIVGKNASVKGEIRTKSLTILGVVEGDVTVTERCELKGSSQLIGDLKAQRMSIEEGAVFVGNSDVNANRPSARLNTSQTVAPVSQQQTPAERRAADRVANLRSPSSSAGLATQPDLMP